MYSLIMYTFIHRKMSQLTLLESLEETSFSSSIVRLVGAADATLQNLASVRQTFGDLKATYCTFKHENLEKEDSGQATQVKNVSRTCLFQVLRNPLQVSMFFLISPTLDLFRFLTFFKITDSPNQNTFPVSQTS